MSNLPFQGYFVISDVIISITIKTLRNIDDYNVRTLTLAQKKEILEKYNYVCMYCYGDADQVDHIIPWSHTHDNREENLVACCWICNLVASNKVFDTFSLKLEHVQAIRYDWIKKHPITLWLRRDVEKLGFMIKGLVENTCVVFDTWDEMYKVKQKLLKEGFRVQT